MNCVWEDGQNLLVAENDESCSPEGCNVAQGWAVSSNLDGYQTDVEWSQNTNSESGHSTTNLQDMCAGFSASCKQVLDVGHDSDGVGDFNRQVTRTAWRTYNTETKLSLTRERVPSRADMCVDYASCW